MNWLLHTLRSVNMRKARTVMSSNTGSIFSVLGFMIKKSVIQGSWWDYMWADVTMNVSNTNCPFLCSATTWRMKITWLRLWDWSTCKCKYLFLLGNTHDDVSYLLIVYSHCGSSLSVTKPLQECRIHYRAHYTLCLKSLRANLYFALCMSNMKWFQ